MRQTYISVVSMDGHSVPEPRVVAGVIDGSQRAIGIPRATVRRADDPGDCRLGEWEQSRPLGRGGL